MSDLDNIFANAKAVKARTSTANESLDSQSSRFTQLLFEELQKIRDEINSKPEMRETIRGEMQIKPLDGNGREASLYGSYPITTVKIIDHRLHISAETYVERSSGASATRQKSEIFTYELGDANIVVAKTKQGSVFHSPEKLALHMLTPFWE